MWPKAHLSKCFWNSSILTAVTFRDELVGVDSTGYLRVLNKISENKNQQEDTFFCKYPSAGTVNYIDSEVTHFQRCAH